MNTHQPIEGKAERAGNLADALIANEVATQDKMWGIANDRADAERGQLLAAAITSARAILYVMRTGFKRAVCFENAKADFYPKDWSPDAFRDYGSDVANLVVASAFLRQEIKRRIIAGESFARSKREQPYASATPNMSAEEATSAVA